MIIRIEKAGTSFRGSGLYYLHDKQPEAERRPVAEQTDERVWFTHTRNCASHDPEKALDEMWFVAESQQWLKAQAGGRTSGRSCSEPVKTITIAWAKDDTPSPEHMVAAADAYLHHMGWDEHQALIVGHSDTAHRHVHIVLNRVHHETGRTLDDYRDRPRSQAFALHYEKEHGRLWCVERELNAADRERRPPELDAAVVTPAPDRRPANQHLPDNVIEIARPFERRFEAHEQARRDAEHAADKAELKVEQREERKAFFDQGAKLFKATRHAVYDEVRKEYAPEWRDYYKEREAAEREAEAASKSAVTRALYFAGRGEWAQAREAFDNRDLVREAVAEQFDLRKSELRQRQTEDLRERQRDACDALREIRDVQYQELLQRQRDERAALKAGQTIETIRLGGNGIAVEPAAERSAANANVIPEPRAEITAARHPGPQPQIETPTPQGAPIVERLETTPAVTPDWPITSLPEAPEPARQLGDLAAGTIGSLANVLADMIGDIIAPTPPEVRDAQAKAQCQTEQPAAAKDTIDGPYARQIEAAMKIIEEERRQQQDMAYWKERDRGKDWERDR